MKKIMLYEPSIGSDNLGDQIIVDSIKLALKEYLEDSFVVELPTHTPLSWRYLNYLGKQDLRFVCGSNLIVGKLNTIIHLKQWAINMSYINKIGPLVLMGVGSQQYNQKINQYTKYVYKKIMNPKYIHSVRDSYTEKALQKIGIKNVINTACPTMWGLTKRHCSIIPVSKSKKCVFTLTDYKPNSKRDNLLIEILLKNYEEVYFWPQGIGDYKYLTSLKNLENVKLINPSLEAYDHFLESEHCDFVGTRLHGGMRALQKGRRTIILGIDNRALELKNDFNLPVISDKNMIELEKFINSEVETNINLPIENIKRFMNQFRGE